MFKSDIKYTISTEWILRHDPFYNNMYSMYNIYDRSLLSLTPAAYTLLKLFYYDALSFDEVKTYLYSHNISIDPQIISTLSHNYNIPEILTPSSKPYHIPTQDNSSFKTEKVPVTSTPLDVELLLTHNCNLRCKHCFQSSNSSSDTHKQLPSSVWYGIFKQFEDCNVYSVVISGGEPMVYKEFDTLLRKISSLRMSINILTNGLLISPRNIDIFLRKNVSTTISLDGHNPQTHDFLRGEGTFKILVPIIKLLKDNNAMINIAHTLHKYNCNYVEDFIRYCIDNGFKNVSINFVEPEGRAVDNQEMIMSTVLEGHLYNTIKELSDKYRKEISIDFPNLSYKTKMSGFGESNMVFCSAGTKRVAISSDGYLYPCVYAIGHSELEIGDLKTSSLNQLWNSHSWSMCRGGIQQERIIGCSTCELSNVCSIKNCRIKYYSKEHGLYSKPRNCFKDKLIKDL